MVACKNCQTLVDQQYCPACGQKSSVGRITLPALINDLPHAVFHVDKGFFYNFINLLKRPGAAIIDYLEGKRKVFFHPATYLVIALVLNYLVVKITDLHFYDEHELTTMDPLQAQALRDYNAMQWWFLEHTYIYILLAIPASSIFVFLLLRALKQKYNIAESAVIILFVIAQGVLLQTILYAIFGWVDSGPFLRGLEMVNLAMLISYASWSVYQLMSSESPKALRVSIAVMVGLGLTIVWIASAYLLYLMMG